MRASFAVAALLGSLGCGESAPPHAGGEGANVVATTSASGGLLEDDPCASYTACSPPPPAVAETQLRLGSGKDCFLPQVDGSALPIVSGPQGGFHIWIALRTSGFGPSPTFTFRVHDGATSLGLLDPMVRTLETCAVTADVREQAHLFAFLAAQDPLAAGALVGTPATLEATLEEGPLSAAASLPFVFGDITVDAHH